MNLLVDIGNTRTKFVNESNGVLSNIASVSNDSLNPLWFTENWSGAERILVSSVNHPNINKLISSWAKEASIDCRFIESEASRFGVENAYQEASTLGVDRWLVLIGAAKLYPNQNILIVDAGTATNVEMLSATGEHLGGWILPGIDLMHDSLLANTSKIFTQTQVNSKTSFGTNTTDCVNNASRAATCGLVHQALLEAERLHATVDLILITGGNARMLKSLLELEVQLAEDLIFQGLACYLGA